MHACLPENYHIVKCYGPCAANGVGTSGDAISLKTAHRAWVLVVHEGSTDTDLVIAIKECTTVALGSATAITATMPIWVSPGTTSDDQWVRQTDAANYTLDPATLGSAMVLIQVDPSILNAGFDCIQAYTTGGNAGNFVAIMYLIEPRWHQDPPVSAIVD